MNSRDRSRVKSQGLRSTAAACLILLAPYAVTKAAVEPSKAAIYTASDFKRLAAGVDPGFSGTALVSSGRPQQTSGSFRKLPVPSLSKSSPGRVIPPRLAGNRSVRSTSPRTVRSSCSSQMRRPRRRALGCACRRALLCVSAGGDSAAPPSFDLVRGRLDSIEPSHDTRRTHARTNNEGVDFQAPASAAAWHDRAQHLREQMLVTLGLWPMFPKTPLNPRITGKLDRGDYTIEKVVLETFPGFTLSGNLYRPAQSTGKIPGMLCPHGHWSDGRVNEEVQPRCIRWAKLGCVVFMYDMVGYNDSKPFPHEFLNDRLRHWGLSLPTLQTWNSIRALDWLTSLPDVDSTRIGCTGESGGGTQTFLLTALDNRVTVSSPVVMVSDYFQGGCVCENAAGLRHGTDNIEFAALDRPSSAGPGRRHRRLDPPHDGSGVSRNPRRLFVDRIHRSRECPDL